MRMRFADQYMFAIASRIKGTLYEEDFRELMKDLGIPFEYLETTSKRGTKSWRLPGYSAQHASLIFANAHRISAFYPPLKKVLHMNQCKTLRQVIQENYIPVPIG